MDKNFFAFQLYWEFDGNGLPAPGVPNGPSSLTEGEQRRIEEQRQQDLAASLHSLRIAQQFSVPGAAAANFPETELSLTPENNFVFRADTPPVEKSLADVGRSSPAGATAAAVPEGAVETGWTKRRHSSPRRFSPVGGQQTADRPPPTKQQPPHADQEQQACHPEQAAPQEEQHSEQQAKQQLPPQIAKVHPQPAHPEPGQQPQQEQMQQHPVFPGMPAGMNPMQFTPPGMPHPQQIPPQMMIGVPPLHPQQNQSFQQPMPMQPQDTHPGGMIPPQCGPQHGTPAGPNNISRQETVPEGPSSGSSRSGQKTYERRNKKKRPPNYYENRDKQNSAPSESDTKQHGLVPQDEDKVPQQGNIVNNAPQQIDNNVNNNAPMQPVNNMPNQQNFLPPNVPMQNMSPEQLQQQQQFMMMTAMHLQAAAAFPPFGMVSPMQQNMAANAMQTMIQQGILQPGMVPPMHMPPPNMPPNAMQPGQMPPQQLPPQDQMGPGDIMHHRENRGMVHEMTPPKQQPVQAAEVNDRNFRSQDQLCSQERQGPPGSLEPAQEPRGNSCGTMSHHPKESDFPEQGCFSERHGPEGPREVVHNVTERGSSVEKRLHKTTAASDPEQVPAQCQGHLPAKGRSSPPKEGLPNTDLGHDKPTTQVPHAPPHAAKDMIKEGEVDQGVPTQTVSHPDQTHGEMAAEVVAQQQLQQSIEKITFEYQAHQMHESIRKISNTDEPDLDERTGPLREEYSNSSVVQSQSQDQFPSLPTQVNNANNSQSSAPRTTHNNGQDNNVKKIQRGEIKKDVSESVVAPTQKDSLSTGAQNPTVLSSQTMSEVAPVSTQSGADSGVLPTSEGPSSSSDGPSYSDTPTAQSHSALDGAPSSGEPEAEAKVTPEQPVPVEAQTPAAENSSQDAQAATTGPSFPKSTVVPSMDGPAPSAPPKPAGAWGAKPAGTWANLFKNTPTASKSIVIYADSEQQGGSVGAEGETRETKTGDVDKTEDSSEKLVSATEDKAAKQFGGNMWKMISM